MDRSIETARRRVEGELASRLRYPELPERIATSPDVQFWLNEAARLLVEAYPDENEEVDFDDPAALSDAIDEAKDAGDIKGRMVWLSASDEILSAIGSGDERAEGKADAESHDAPPPRRPIIAPHLARGRETKAAEALSSILAWEFNQDDDVRGFRSRVFGSEVGVDLESGLRFLTSPLAKVVPVDVFAALKLLPLEAEGEVRARSAAGWMTITEATPLLFRGGVGHRPMDRASLPERIEFLASIVIPGISPEDATAIRLLWLPTSGYEGVLWPPSLNYSSTPHGDSIFRLSPLHLPMPAYMPYMAETRYLEGMGGSVAVEAIRVCEHVMASCPVDIWGALEFLITGSFTITTMSAWLYPYNSPPITTGERAARPFFAWGPARIEFQPWMTPEEVGDYWKRVRAGRQSEIRPRLPAEDELDMFLFMLAKTPPGQKPRWTELWQDWEKEQRAAGKPVKRLENPSDRMLKVFNAVRGALLPGYTTRREGKAAKPKSTRLT